MPAMLEIDSTLTDRYQTTVPETVRRALKLHKRDKLHYSIFPDGAVMLTRADNAESEDDPVLGQFLGFLARDIAANPDHIQTINPDLITRIRSLVDKTEIDINAPLSVEDE
jgi:antitoxin PrlF